MSSEQIAKAIIWDDLLKVVLIEPRSGSYEVIKGISDATEDALLGSSDIFAYAQMMADLWLIHPNDVDRYLSIVHSLRRADGTGSALDGKRFSRKMRYLVEGKYIWATFEILYPADYRQTSRSCVLCIRRADSRIGGSDSELSKMADMAHVFLKVLKIDLASDTFETIKLPDGEGGSVPEDARLSSWFAEFAATKNVHMDDLDVFAEFTDVDRIRETFAKNDGAQSCKYRRRVANEWRWVTMLLMPSIEYTEETPILMLYVRDDDAKPLELAEAVPEIQEEVEARDELTGLKDLLTLENDMTEVEARVDEKHGVGVICLRMNGLPWTLENEGAEAVDKRLLEMAALLSDTFSQSKCYRVSDDEFAVMQPFVREHSFETWAERFREDVRLRTPPEASVGYAWEKVPQSIPDLLRSASWKMQRDVDEFSRKYPIHSGRRRASPDA